MIDNPSSKRHIGYHHNTHSIKNSNIMASSPNLKISQNNIFFNRIDTEKNLEEKNIISNIRNNLNNAINKTLKFLQKLDVNNYNLSDNNLYSNPNLYSDKNLTNENTKLKKRNNELKNKYEILKNSLNIQDDNGANMENYITSENDSLYNNLIEQNNELKNQNII